MRKTWFLMAALGLALMGRASAAPSFFGPTGLLVIPTADTLAERTWNVHVHGIDNLTTYGASYGITKALEFGVSGVSPAHTDAKALINAKYTLLMETGKLPAIAIGGVDIAGQLDNQDPGFYVVVSKSLSSLIGKEV